MDKEKPAKKSKKPYKDGKSSQLNRRNSNINNKKEEKSPTKDKEKTDNSTENLKGINSIPGKEHLNGAVALIIMPEVAEMVVNQEQKEGNPEKNSPRPVSALSVASSSPPLNQALAYTELSDENEEQNLDAKYESTALFQTCIPYLPVEIAVVCLVFNILIPGFGSLLCGISNFCCGKMQETVKKQDVPMKVFINLLVGIMQLLTVTFMLVGWFWSVAWGIKILLLSIQNQKRIKKAKLLRDKRQKAKFAFTYADEDENQCIPTLKY